MDTFPDKSGFQIILQTDDVDDISEYWQRQCKTLYEDLYRALPEGYIKPSTREVSPGERTHGIILFSSIVVSEIAVKYSASIIFEALNNWSENTRDAHIKVKCPNGNIIEIPKKSLSKLSMYSNGNPNLSIYKVLSRVINFTK